jgi:hypothetical protein
MDKGGGLKNNLNKNLNEDLNTKNDNENENENEKDKLRRESYTLKNERGLLVVFFPIILFSLVFFAFDSYTDYENFMPVYYYFKDLYSNRFFIFAMIIFGWKYAKSLVSGYILLLIVYVFNILIVLSDIFNINKFIIEYNNKFEGSLFYKNLFIKNIFNVLFLISWSIILVYNLYKWYQIYKMSQRIEITTEKTE